MASLRRAVARRPNPGSGRRAAPVRRWAAFLLVSRGDKRGSRPRPRVGGARVTKRHGMGGRTAPCSTDSATPESRIVVIARDAGSDPVEPARWDLGRTVIPISIKPPVPYGWRVWGRRGRGQARRRSRYFPWPQGLPAKWTCSLLNHSYAPAQSQAARRRGACRGRCRRAGQPRRLRRWRLPAARGRIGAGRRTCDGRRRAARRCDGGLCFAARGELGAGWRRCCRAAAGWRCDRLRFAVRGRRGGGWGSYGDLRR
jgi:hypothetical protein